MLLRPAVSSFLVLALAAAGAALLPSGPVKMPDLVDEYRADDRSVEAAYDLPWSELRLNRLKQHHEEWQARLDAADFSALSRPEQIDWLLLRNHLKHELAQQTRERAQMQEMEALLPFRRAIQDLEAARMQRTPVDAEKAASALTALIKPLEDLRGRIEDRRKAPAKPAKQADSGTGNAGGAQAPAPDAGSGSGPVTAATTAPNSPEALPEIGPVPALRAAAATSAIRNSLQDWFRFYDGFQPDFSWWVRQPYTKLMEALESHAKYLREEIAGQRGKPEDPLTGDPLGSAALAAEIEGEMLPYTAEELIAIGEREFAWCEERLREAAREMGTDTAGALEKVKAAHVPPGGQDELAVAEAARSIAFLKQHDLVTIPPLCEETWRLEMIAPETQKTLPYAVYGQPAMMIAYAAESMPHEDKLMSMRGNNRHFMRIVTPHELIPGHHLQKFAASRSRSWRSLFSTPFYVEGWALHWEMLLWDRNYADSPEDRVGMLFWRMHRCARIIVSLKFHLGRMTPAEMVDFLVQRVGHERMGATSEVRRYIGGAYGPLYQAGYMLGGLQIRALHRELTGPGKLTDKQFHDAVLAENAMPIEMLREALTANPLSREWKSTWRFAE